MKFDLKNYETISELTQEDIDFYSANYGIDITSSIITSSERELLINYRRFGASLAIMNLINKLQQEV